MSKMKVFNGSLNLFIATQKSCVRQMNWKMGEDLIEFVAIRPEWIRVLLLCPRVELHRDVLWWKKLWDASRKEMRLDCKRRIRSYLINVIESSPNIHRSIIVMIERLYWLNISLLNLIKFISSNLYLHLRTSTAGQERFRTITSAYYRGAMGIMLVYDITQEKSFENIKNWIRNIEENASTDVEKMLLGNKCELNEKRQVTKERGEQLAIEYGIKFLETSAKNSINVEEAFFNLARDIKSKMEKRLVSFVRNVDNFWVILIDSFYNRKRTIHRKAAVINSKTRRHANQHWTGWNATFGNDTVALLCSLR